MSALSPRRAWNRRLMVLMSVAVLSAVPVAAQTTSYEYQGNPFNQFSCGPFVDSQTGNVTGTLNCSSPAPTNTNTSYTAADFVSATLLDRRTVWRVPSAIDGS